jgi:hypothetical protein
MLFIPRCYSRNFIVSYRFEQAFFAVVRRINFRKPPVLAKGYDEADNEETLRVYAKGIRESKPPLRATGLNKHLY